MISAMVFFISVDVRLESLPVALNAKKSSISGVGLRPEMEKMEMKNGKKPTLLIRTPYQKILCSQCRDRESHVSYIYYILKQWIVFSCAPIGYSKSGCPELLTDSPPASPSERSQTCVSYELVVNVADRKAIH